MSLSILHVLDHSLPLHSGYAFRTVSLLREQRKREWQTWHLTTPKQKGNVSVEEEIEGWHFYRTRAAADCGLLAHMKATAGRLDELVRSLSPDVIHAHSPVLNALPALWVGRRRGLPVVYEMRASWEDAAVDHGSTSEGSLRYRASRALESFALRRADEVTTICEGLRGDITMRGVAEDKVTVIPNAVDAANFAFAASPDGSLRSSLGLDDCPVVGFVGSFYGYEGLDLLMDAVAELAAHYPTLRALMVGGGVQEANLKVQVARLGLAERVIFTGRVPHAEVQRYYRLIDVLAYPRRSIRLTELVTPLKPLEAMAQGLMLVASDVGGHRELIRDGETGTLFRAGDAGALAIAIREVLEHRERWPKMLAEARRFVESERTWANSVARYRDVYLRALSSRGRTLPDGT
jgi:PEP-CTERM/exosortase A-associated glycosyltransferase